MLNYGTNLEISEAQCTDINAEGVTLVSLDTISNKISVSGTEAEEISIDSFASAKTGYKAYAQGLKDPGELSFDGYYKPGSPAHEAVAKAYKDGLTRLIVVTFPTGDKYKALGFVKSHPFDIGVAEVASTSISIRLSGEPVLVAHE